MTGLVEKHGQLGAQQIEVSRVARQKHSTLGGDGQASEVYVFRIRAVPSVKAAPPLSVAVLTDDSIGSDVVGHDAAVGVDPLDPGLAVVEHPGAIFFLARVQESVRHQGRGGEIGRCVAVEDQAVEEGDDLVSSFGGFMPVRLEVLDQRIQRSALLAAGASVEEHLGEIGGIPPAPAQSCASVPPEPDCISKYALLGSILLENILLNSS